MRRSDRFILQEIHDPLSRNAKPAAKTSASPEDKYSASPKVWENKDDFSQECRCGEGRVIGSRQREKLGYAQERLRRYWEGVRRLSRALSVASQLILATDVSAGFIRRVFF
jgi:hypothetical protein